MSNATRTTPPESHARSTLTQYRLGMISRAIATLVVAGLCVLAPATSAHADDACFNKSDRIITPEEYAQLEPGTTTLPQVKTITGASGVPMDPPTAGYPIHRSWKVCAKPGWVLMSFQRVPGQGLVLEWTQVRWS